MFFSFITSIFLTWLSIPSIIRISNKLNLYDSTNERKVHTYKISRLGGIPIFFSVIFSLIFWSTSVLIVEVQYILAALILLFLTGLKDDVLGIRAHKKLIIQIISASIVVGFANIEITTFYGLFGIGSIPDWFSFLLTLFVIVSITNSFNLIDGIDGLAAIVGIFSSICFGGWFYLVDSAQFALLSFTLAGALTGFIIYNWNPAKIFMGDAGSLIVGFIISILAVKFIEMNRVIEKGGDYKVMSVPVVTISILIVPIFDTLRVFIYRIFIEKRSPFSPDRNHLHHIMIDSGLSVKKSVLVILSFNLICVLTTFLLKGIISGELLLLLIFIEAIFFLLITVKRKELVLGK